MKKGRGNTTKESPKPSRRNAVEGQAPHDVTLTAPSVPLFWVLPPLYNFTPFFLVSSPKEDLFASVATPQAHNKPLSVFFVVVLMGATIVCCCWNKNKANFNNPTTILYRVLFKDSTSPCVVAKHDELELVFNRPLIPHNEGTALSYLTTDD
eukprot:scaffold7221_cov165-Amphora_coffeaeformis.AAC.11